MMESQIAYNLDSEQLKTTIAIDCVDCTDASRSSRSTSTGTEVSGNSLGLDVDHKDPAPIAIQQTANTYHCNAVNNASSGYDQFNYITQDYSNLAFYNGANTTCPSSLDTADDFPFFNNSSAIDFPFITTDTLPSPSDKFQLDDNIQYFNLLHAATASSIIESNILRDNLPEYIDINSLVIPTHCFPSSEAEDLSNNKVTIKLETNANVTNANANANVKSDNQQAVECKKRDDVDVVFVKEYKCVTATKSSTCAKKVTTETAVPRRNPKRQVQMQKVSYDLAAKLSRDGCCDGRRCVARDLSAFCATPINTRRSTRLTGAVLSPPTNLKTTDYKQWPVDGMHEKPTFNPVTKKIEKLPSTPKKSTKGTNGRTRKRTAATAGNAATAGARKKKENNSKQNEYEAKKSFATMTHHTLHYVLSYVNSVKEYNARIGKQQYTSFLEDNVVKAGDLLSDACILYCIANDVSETSLAKYLSAVTTHDNVTEFLDCIVDGCDANPSPNN